MKKLTAATAVMAGLMTTGTALATDPNVILQPFGAVQARSAKAAGTDSTDSTLFGGGIKVAAPLLPWMGLKAEIQALSGDVDGTANTEIDQLDARLSAEFGIAAGASRFTITPQLLTVGEDNGTTDETNTGVGLHLGLRSDHGGHLNGYAQLGFVALDTNNSLQGLEVNAGVSTVFGRGVGMFADYRMQKFENDNNGELDSGQLRLGLHVQF